LQRQIALDVILYTEYVLAITAWGAICVLVGIAQADMTPPVGTWLVGYLDRTAVSTSIADRLKATALALRDGATTLVVVSCEVLAIHPGLLAMVRDRVSKAAAIAPDAVWIVATHTHSGPPTELTTEVNATERAYIATLPEVIAGVAIAAIADLEPAEVRFGRGRSDLGQNRRHIVNGAAVMEPAPGRPLDDELAVIDIKRSNGSRKAILTVVACHPVTVGRDNLTVGGDYPGALSRLIESKLGARALFAMGASGDVNPRFGPVPDASGKESAAQALIGPVETTLVTSAPVGSGLAFAGTTADFPISPSRIDRGVGQRPHIDHLVQLAGMSWPEIDMVMDRRHPWHGPVPGDYHLQDHVPGEIDVARVGSLAIVALPFEVFSAVGLEIKRRSPFPDTIVIGQTNGALGYLAPAEEHPYGGYEICESSLFYRTRGPLSQEATVLAIDTTLGLLRSLSQGGVQ
jgi:hypothetical protein